MEMEILRPDTPPTVNAIELTWSGVDTSALTAENRKDALHRRDNCTTWTEQKHNSYLNNLEVSFVEQLQQSKGLFAQSHDKKNHRGASTCQKSSMNFTVLRNGCWQKIKYDRAEPLSRSSADSSNHLKSPWIYRLRCTGAKGSLPSEDMEKVPELPEEGNNKRTMSHGVTKSSHQFASINSNEGSGQNFMEEENQSRPKMEFQAKRLKTALGDSSNHDQIVPANFSSFCPPT